MGLFGNTNRIYVGTAVGRLVPDETVSDLGKTSILKAVLSDQGITDTLLDDLKAGIGNKANSVFDFALKEKYALGLPTSYIERGDYTSNEDFMPFVMFRENKNRITETDSKYESTVDLCKKLNFDFDDLNDKIHNHEEIDKLEQAIMMFGIPVDSEHKLGRSYVFEFFYWLALKDTVYNSPRFIIDENGNEVVNNAITFEDASFKMQLNYSGIAHNTNIGQAFDNENNPLKVGDVALIIESRLQPYTHSRLESGSDGGDIVEERRTKLVYIHKFYKQLEENLYGEVLISGFSCIYTVANKEVFIDTTDTIGGRILVPINKAILDNKFNVIERDTIYGLSLTLVFNSLTVERIPWYANAFFTGVLFITGIVLTVFSLGAAAPETIALYGALSAAYGVVVAIILVALDIILINLITTEVFSFVAENIGLDNALIVSLLIIAGAIYGQQINANWAENLLKVGTNLIASTNNSIQEELDDISDSLTSLENENEARQKELDAAKEELKNTDIMDLLSPTGLMPLTVLGESPSSFYSRTSLLNIPQLSYDYISKYYDIQKTLPTLKETLSKIK